MKEIKRHVFQSTYLYFQDVNFRVYLGTNCPSEKRKPGREIQYIMKR